MLCIFSVESEWGWLLVFWRAQGQGFPNGFKRAGSFEEKGHFSRKKGTMLGQLFTKVSRLFYSKFYPPKHSKTCAFIAFLDNFSQKIDVLPNIFQAKIHFYMIGKGHIAKN